MKNIKIEFQYTPDNYGCSGLAHFKKVWNMPDIPITYKEVTGNKYDKVLLFNETGKIFETSAIRVDLLSSYILNKYGYNEKNNRISEDK